MRITGRVQGVGFRDFVLRQARDLGVQGWVRNLSDGSVSCEAQASPATLDRFMARLREGPRFSRVAALEVDELSAAEGPAEGFRIR